jgi:hypothetical protein
VQASVVFERTMYLSQVVAGRALLVGQCGFFFREEDLSSGESEEGRLWGTASRYKVSEVGAASEGGMARCS